MSWRKLAPHIYSAAKVTATGASITLGSTVFSCYLALQIEAASHRTLFAFFPHWYQNVEYANGIDPELLASVRMQARLEQQEKQKAQMVEAAIKPQEQQQPTTEKQDDSKTIFTVEGLVEPVVKQVQELSFTSDMSACAMTS